MAMGKSSTKVSSCHDAPVLHLFLGSHSLKLRIKNSASLSNRPNAGFESYLMS